VPLPEIKSVTSELLALIDVNRLGLRQDTYVFVIKTLDYLIS